MTPAHFPNVSWLLLAFVVLSALAHGLGLLISSPREVQLTEQRFGTTIISTVLLPAENQPTKDQPSANPSHQVKSLAHTTTTTNIVSQITSSAEPRKPSHVSRISVTRASEFKITPITTTNTIPKASPNRTTEPTRIDPAPKTFQQPDPVIDAKTATNFAAQPSTEQLASQQKEQREKQRNFLLGELQNRLSRYLSYPVVARRRGWQGEVMVTFDINVTGQLNNVRLARSSGYSVLDHSAVTAINKLQQISLPDTLGQLQAMELQLPVRYQLHES